MRVLILFAGRERQSDLGCAMRSAFARYTEGSQGTALEVDEVDILRGGEAHDLLSASKREAILQGIAAGRWHIVVAFPSVHRLLSCPLP